jgi:LysM repeat protein
MIAAALLSKNRDLFGFKVDASPEQLEKLEGKVAALEESGVNLEPGQDVQEKEAADEADLAAKKEGGTGEGVADNQGDPTDSEFSKDITPGALDALLKGYNDGYAQKGESLPAVFNSETTADLIATPHVSKQGVVAGDHIVEVEIQAPADLLKISSAAGVPYDLLKSINPEILRWCTPPGVTRYTLKLPKSSKRKFLATYNHPSFPRTIEFRTYKTKGGESLASIARKLGIRPEPLEDLNKTSSRVALAHGRNIALPAPNDATRSWASLELTEPKGKRRARSGKRKPSSRGAWNFERPALLSPAQRRAARASGTVLEM